MGHPGDSAALPSALSQAIESAYAAMERHPEHMLLPVYRQAIYRAIGPQGDPMSHQALARLALLSAWRVLPIWQRQRPDDHTPERLLATAEDMMTGPWGSALHEAVAERAWHWLTSLKMEHSAVFAAHAAVVTVSGVRGDWYGAPGGGFLEGVSIGENDMDDKFFDPGICDAAMFAVSAYAEPQWDREYDPAKGHEFWTWWLREAIPMAWATVYGAHE